MQLDLCAINIARGMLEARDDTYYWGDGRYLTCKSTGCKVGVIIVLVFGCIFWIWIITSIIRLTCLGHPARTAFRCCAKKPQDGEYAMPLQQPQPLFNGYDPNLTPAPLYNTQAYQSYNGARMYEQHANGEFPMQDYPRQDQLPQKMDQVYQPVTVYGPERQNTEKTDLGGAKPLQF